MCKIFINDPSYEEPITYEEEEQYRKERIQYILEKQGPIAAILHEYPDLLTELDNKKIEINWLNWFYAYCVSIMKENFKSIACAKLDLFFKG